MSQFQQIKKVLKHIDAHLDEPLNIERLAGHFYFSAAYFHRMFSLIVGKPLAVYIRERRLQSACMLLQQSNRSILDIALDCGYQSAQSFSRAFKTFIGCSPSAYRAHDASPDILTVEAIVMKFTNRLKGGICLNPKIVQRGALRLAGISGDGQKTGEVWCSFEALLSEHPVPCPISTNGYEVRLYDGNHCKVHVGYAMSGRTTCPPYTVLRLPASKYALFDVYVAKGYESENAAMAEWLATNSEGYRERLLDGAHYCIEYYDERFCGDEIGSIVEIWIPIEK